MSQHFDYIICGAGLSGLSLAQRLAEKEYEDKSILLLDKSRKDLNDRTWSFWTTKGDNRFESIYRKSWNKMAFFAPGVEAIDTPGEYSYHTISGIDFYNYSFNIIQQTSHIQFKLANLQEITDLGNKVEVHTSEGMFTADYVFDSVVRKFPERHNLFVWQHFLGWEIELLEGQFDEETATFMDFRIDQQQDTRFVYVLPFSKKKALVEATIFSKDIASETEYEVILKEYINKYYGEKYKVHHREMGAIPMTTASFGKGSQRVICIGTNNATVKPSSGYAFTRIQQECDLLVSYIKIDKIRKVIRKARFLAYDRTLLNVLLTNKESGREIFAMLFACNDMSAILKFLDENTNVLEEIKIFNTLPFWSFLRAFTEENVLHFTK